MRRIVAVISFGFFAACGVPALAAPSGSFPVFFQPWSAAIDSTAAGTIALAAKAAKADPDLPVIVTGSADTVGSTAANKDIALTRAQVVSDALVADGVAPSRIAIVSTGAISAPGTATGTFAQFSRRVLIRVGN